MLLHIITSNHFKDGEFDGEFEQNKNVKQLIINHLTFTRVRLIGLEPTQRKLLDPKSSASTNFATGACFRG